MIYGTQYWGITDWVGFMSDSTKEKRVQWIRDLNMGGVTDWALDLQQFRTWSTPPDQGGGSDKFVLRNIDFCDKRLWPSTLEEADKNIDSLPLNCRGVAITRILVNSLEGALNKYSEVSFGADYDEKFGYYADWVKDAIDLSLDEFMRIGRGKGLPFLDCEWSTRKTEGRGPCTKAVLPYDQGQTSGPRIVKFTMRDEKGFYDALLAETGIQRSWIRWQDKFIELDPCPPCPTPTCSHQAACQSNYYARYNYPRRISDTSKIDITNPKKSIDDALPKLVDLVNQGVDTYTMMRFGDSGADPGDVIQSLSMPIFMLEDSFESISKVKEIGADQKNKKTRDLIVLILTIVFAVIPIVGEIAGFAACMARLATAALIIGEMGNAALAIEEIVRDANSAPFAVLGILIAAGGIRSKGPRQGYEDAAAARKALPPSALSKFSPAFRHKDEIIQRMLKKCMTS